MTLMLIMLNGLFEKSLKRYSATTTTTSHGNYNHRDFEKAHNAGAVLTLSDIKPGICVSGGYNQKVVAYDYFQGKKVQVWQEHQQPVTRVAYGYKCELIASASRDKTIKLWRENQGEALVTFSAHDLPITGLDFSPDNKILCSGSRDNTIKIWDLSTEALLKSCKKARNLVTHLKWAPVSNMIVQTSEDKEVRIWDARTLQVTITFPVKQHMQTHCDMTTDEAYILTGSNGTSGNGCEASLWDVRQCNLLREFKEHEETINSCKFINVDDKTQDHIATASQDGTLRVWNCHTGECLNALSLDGAGALNDVVVLDGDSLGVATYHKGIQRLLRGFQYTGRWILKKISNF